MFKVMLLKSRRRLPSPLLWYCDSDQRNTKRLSALDCAIQNTQVNSKNLFETKPNCIIFCFCRLYFPGMQPNSKLTYSQISKIILAGYIPCMLFLFYRGFYQSVRALYASYFSKGFPRVKRTYCIKSIRQGATCSIYARGERAVLQYIYVGDQTRVIRFLSCVKCARSNACMYLGKEFPHQAPDQKGLS